MRSNTSVPIPMARNSNPSKRPLKWLFVAATCALLTYEQGWVTNRLDVSSTAWKRPLFGAMAEEATGNLKITEDELKQYDGTDPDKPIYLAIDGVIFDVSISPAFYGPGGHYHHFTGKDASRAWVSECWDSEDQLTWRMDGIEDMFMPKYLDESMERTAAGESDIEGAVEYGGEELAKMAQTILKKMGKVSEKEMAKRRKSDKKEAAEAVQTQLQHWFNFFNNNDKYTAVGKVIHDEKKPEPPALCEAALKKRPHKGGKLDDLVKRAGQAGGIFDGGKMPPPEKMPDFVQDAMHKKRGVHKTVSVDDDDENLVKEEL